MPQNNSVGILAGLAFVALFLVMISSIHSVARLMLAPPSSYELAGGSTPAK